MTVYQDQSLKNVDKVNKIIAYIPIAMSVWCAVLLFFFISSDWYAKNYFWLDNLDICLCCLLIFHYVYFDEFYTKLSKSCLLSLIILNVLNFVCAYIDIDYYYYIYITILIYPYIRFLWTNLM